jgi:hypothetical protein
MKILYRIDEKTEYYFGNKNGLNNSIYIKMNGIREPENGHKGNQRIDSYTRENMIKYYSVDRGEFKLDETKKFIIDTKRELIFIPLSNKDGNIVDYGITCLKYYDKIKDYSFYRFRKGKRKYVNCSNGKRMHEIIFGRKAKQGGWEKVENYVETEETKSAVWLTSIGVPLPHIGKKWNFCRDEQGNVYIKYPGYVIDHRNSDGLDNRSVNLREIPFSTNTANKSKVKGRRMSDYFGVTWSQGKWVGNVKNNGVWYYKRFDNEIEAAIFRDMYALVVFKEIICNNGMLTEEQTEDILKRGEAAIPKNYKATQKKKRDLPKYIIKDKELFRVSKHYNGKQYFKSFKTLDEAKAAVPLLLNEIQKLKDENEKIKIESKRHNTNEKYGFLESRDINGNINAIVKLNKSVWEKFAKFTWSMSNNKRLKRNIDGFDEEIHVHVFRLFFEEYHRTVHGTIDHTKQDEIIDGIYYSDCTIENLRCATFSQQTQNRENMSVLPYKGVTLSNGKFFANFSWKGVRKFGKRRKYIEDAAKDYNDFALEKWDGAKLNIISDKKTTVEDLFHKSVLTLDKIQKFSKAIEIISTLYVNEDWAVECNISNFKNINNNNWKKYHEIIIKLFLKEEINFCVAVDDIEEGEETNEIKEDEEIEDQLEDEDEDECEKIDFEYEDDEVLELNVEENFKYIEPVRRIETPIDPETDASKIGNWVYGYEKGFDRSKVLIKEDEAEIIRLIFKEKDAKTTVPKILQKIIDSKYLKRGKIWTLGSVRTVLSHRDKYEGKLIDGFRHPKII